MLSTFLPKSKVQKCSQFLGEDNRWSIKVCLPSLPDSYWNDQKLQQKQNPNRRNETLTWKKNTGHPRESEIWGLRGREQADGAGVEAPRLKPRDKLGLLRKPPHTHISRQWEPFLVLITMAGQGASPSGWSHFTESACLPRQILGPPREKQSTAKGTRSNSVCGCWNKCPVWMAPHPPQPETHSGERTPKKTELCNHKGKPCWMLNEQM